MKKSTLTLDLKDLKTIALELKNSLEPQIKNEFNQLWQELKVLPNSKDANQIKASLEQVIQRLKRLAKQTEMEIKTVLKNQEPKKSSSKSTPSKKTTTAKNITAAQKTTTAKKATTGKKINSRRNVATKTRAAVPKAP